MQRIKQELDNRLNSIEHIKKQTEDAKLLHQKAEVEKSSLEEEIEAKKRLADEEIATKKRLAEEEVLANKKSAENAQAQLSEVEKLRIFALEDAAAARQQADSLTQKAEEEVLRIFLQNFGDLSQFCDFGVYGLQIFVNFW